MQQEKNRNGRNENDRNEITLGIWHSAHKKHNIDTIVLKIPVSPSLYDIFSITVG